MTNNFITIISGFILPANNHYKIVNADKTRMSDFFNRHTSADFITSYSKHSDIYTSDVINQTYDAYNNDKSFDNFIRILDITFDILSNMELITFFKLQASNSNLSNMSYKFCIDVLTNLSKFNYTDYYAVPYNMRFTANNGLSSSEMSKRINEIEKLFNSNVLPITWENFLTELSKEKDALVMFFKYIFTDVY